jgi:hypothetical protein
LGGPGEAKKKEGSGALPKKSVRVKCYVDSCKYWDQKNLCDADAIEVDNQSVNQDMEIGTIGEGNDEAKTSKATYCRTFSPKNQA